MKINGCPINFNKAHAEDLLDCIRTGRPISGPWSVDQMLAVAGACMFTILTHGPAMMPDVAAEGVQPEQREHAHAQLRLDVSAGIEFYAYLTQLVADGGYDADFHPQVQAIVRGGDPPSLVPISGAKG